MCVLKFTFKALISFATEILMWKYSFITLTRLNEFVSRNAFGLFTSNIVSHFNYFHIFQVLINEIKMDRSLGWKLKAEHFSVTWAQKRKICLFSNSKLISFYFPKASLSLILSIHCFQFFRAWKHSDILSFTVSLHN